MKGITVQKRRREVQRVGYGVALVKKKRGEARL